MGSSVFFNEFSSTQTLPGPLYKFTIAAEMLWRRAESSVARFMYKKAPAIDMHFAESRLAAFECVIQTPYGARKIHSSGPLVACLNDEFHRTNLPLARQSNMRVTAFSSRRELIVSEQDRDGKAIFKRLLDVEKGKIIAKTVRGDMNKWEMWD